METPRNLITPTDLQGVTEEVTNFYLTHHRLRIDFPKFHSVGLGEIEISPRPRGEGPESSRSSRFPCTFPGREKFSRNLSTSCFEMPYLSRASFLSAVPFISILSSISAVSNAGTFLPFFPDRENPLKPSRGTNSSPKFWPRHET